MGPVVALVIAVGNQNHLRYLLYKSGTGDYIMHQPGEEDQVGKLGVSLRRFFKGIKVELAGYISDDDLHPIPWWRLTMRGVIPIYLVN